MTKTINDFQCGAIMLGMLLGVPLLASLLIPAGYAPYEPLVVLLAVALLARLPILSHPISRLSELARHPSPRAARWTALAIWLLSSAYFLGTALHQHRDLFPRIHDEHCYLIQSRMIAAGRLWMPQHPLADFFDTFYMLVHPVYASIYFPGTALLNAPFVRLGCPYWTMPVLVAGLTVALTYRVTTLLIDGVAGWIAVAMALGAYGLREFSTMVMAQAPMALFGVLILWAWLNWRKEHRLPWAIVLGICCGWAAITRPVDALAFALPVAMAMLLDWRQIPPWRRLATIVLILAAAAPFFALQAILNRGTTGSLLSTPYQLYLQQDMPGSGFGFHPFNAATRPLSTLPQKTQYWQTVRLDEIRQHTLRHLPADLAWRTVVIALCTLPSGILALLLLAVPFSLKDRRRSIVLCAAPLFLLIYLFNPFFLAHYPVPLVPVMAFAIALAVNVLTQGRDSFLPLMILAVCIASLPEFRHDIHDGTIPAMPISKLAHDQLASHVQAPAVVLFRFAPTDKSVEEPVYNDDVIWPDDAPIIRAHDLGPRNIEIARYYAAHRPNRQFYLLDRQENQNRTTLLLHPLGQADEYLHRLESGPNRD